jgi:predicted O-methyltransferase YrrM
MNNTSVGDSADSRWASVERVLERFYASKEKLDRNGKSHFLTATSVTRGEATELARIVFEHQPQQTLEIGLAIGASALAISSAKLACGLKEPHIALDPFQERLSGGVGLQQLENAGVDKAVHWKCEFSEEWLVRQREAGVRFDMIFIDGGHSIGQAVTDTFLAHDVLKPGGVIAIHDALLFSTMASVRHLVQERGYTVKKLRPDGRMRNTGRIAKYGPQHGSWYAFNVISRIHRSLVALIRPPESIGS